MSTLPRLFLKSGSVLKGSAFVLILCSAGTATSLDRPQAAAIEPAMFQFLEKFHGHTCAGSLMGARLGHAAKAALQAEGVEGKLKAKYFDHSCPVDGVQVAAGTTFGNHAIEVEDKNEQRLLLSAEKNTRQVEARLTKAAEERGKRFRELKNRERDLPAGSAQRQKLSKEVEDLLNWFKTAPDAEVVQLQLR